MKKRYAGTLILEDMSFSQNYNKFIKNLGHKWVYRKESKIIIDYGAGSGEFCLNNCQNTDFFAVEPDKYLKKKLKDRGITVVDFQKIKERSVNYIYSINVLEHIDNDEKVLSQIQKVYLSKEKCLYTFRISVFMDRIR